MDNTNAAAGEPPSDAAPASAQADRVERARMLHYRLVPLWFFIGTFGVLLVWEFGVKHSPATVERLQGIALLSLFVAILLGATVGIRYSNPLPPKQ
jgi:hypothetical protein